MVEDFQTMFVTMAGVAAVPFISRNIRLPSSVVEIILGLILFKFLIKNHYNWLSLMKELGFIYLMFLAGMELDVQEIVKKPKFKWYLVIPLLSLTCTPLVFFLMGLDFFLGIAASVTSAGILIPILMESGLNKTELGKDILGVTIMGELLSIVFLTFFEVYQHTGVSLAAIGEIAKLFILLIAAGTVLKLLYLLSWWMPEHVERVMESLDPVEEGIRVLITTALAGAVLAYHARVEPILGSFMAGLIFSYVFKNKGKFEEKIKAVGFGFFIPFFFVGIGADFDISLLNPSHKNFVNNMKLSLVLTLSVFLSNIFPIIFKKWLNLKTIEAFAMALLLSAPLSMVFVAGAIGTKMRLISSQMNDVLIISAMFSSLLYPACFRIMSKRLIEKQRAI
jgi:Kef-type K+ transport system membrane component KefB